MLRKLANAQAQGLHPLAAKFKVGSSDVEAGLSRRRFLRASGLKIITREFSQGKETSR